MVNRTLSALSATTGLVAVTAVSKLLGFVREIALLESLGAGLDLDRFLAFFGIVNLVTGALGICIVTNITPIAAQFKGRSGAVAVMRSAVIPAVMTWAIATIICLSYALYEARPTRQFLLLPLAVASIVPFSLLAEYQVGLLISRGRRLPVIAGNLLISVPLVIALVLLNLSIVGYAIGLAVSFAFRNVVFAMILTRKEGDETTASSPVPNLFAGRVAKTLAGGSAILGMSLVYLMAIIVARQFGAGAATLVGYSLKIPMLVLASLWFVLGTGFFSSLVRDGSMRIVRRILVLTGINGLAFGAIAVFVLSVNHLSEDYRSLMGKTEILDILSQSLPMLPLIILVPMIEMVQRLYVTEGRHEQVAIMAAVVIVTSGLAQFFAWTADAFALLMWSPTIAASGGFGIACLLLVRRQRTQAAQAGLQFRKGPA